MARRVKEALYPKSLARDIALIRAAQATGDADAIRAAINEADLFDGQGLSLVVTAAGRARWVHKYTWQGKTAERWLPGEFPEVTIAGARKACALDRKLVRDRINPIAYAKAYASSLVGVPTFADYARAHAEFLAPRNPRGRRAWLRHMTGEETDGETVGKLAAMSIDAIKMDDVKAVIAPLWLTKPVTAKELCGRIRRVLDHRYANTGAEDRKNPADFKWIGRAIGKRFEKHSRSRAALDYLEVPGFLRTLRGHQQTSARLLEMVIATGCRVNEIAGARWGEIDLRARTFTIPAERMKTQHNDKGEAHVIPLTIAMLKALRGARRPYGKPHPRALIFPNGKGKRYQTKDVLVHVHAIAGKGKATSHGFRSTLINWGTAIPHRTCAAFDRELMEVCLAHALGDQVSQAYLRDRWLDRRRLVMQEWSWFCLTPVSASVIRLRRAA